MQAGCVGLPKVPRAASMTGVANRRERACSPDEVLRTGNGRDINFREFVELCDMRLAGRLPG